MFPGQFSRPIPPLRGSARRPAGKQSLAARRLLSPSQVVFDRPQRRDSRPGLLPSTLSSYDPASGTFRAMTALAIPGEKAKVPSRIRSPDHAKDYSLSQSRLGVNRSSIVSGIIAPLR